VDSSLVCEGTEPGHRVVEWNVHLDNTRDIFFDRLQLGQVVLRFGVLGRCHDHASHQSAEWGDAVPFTDSKYTRVDVGSPALEGCESICDCAAGVVVEMGLCIVLVDQHIIKD
jgi:hypothetical protein